MGLKWRRARAIPVPPKKLVHPEVACANSTLTQVVVY
jgi:hypothetical protein